MWASERKRRDTGGGPSHITSRNYPKWSLALLILTLGLVPPFRAAASSPAPAPTASLATSTACAAAWAPTPSDPSAALSSGSPAPAAAKAAQAIAGLAPLESSRAGMAS